MGLILCLETATKMCAVSLVAEGETVKSYAHYSEKYSHAEKLNGLIISLFEETEYDLQDLDAVAVSEGPGSYTGLRIGTSTAKGLCYALDIPLIAVNSLKALAATKKGADALICPMFDARRMEVYVAVFDGEMNTVRETEALVVDEYAFADLPEKKQLLFIGPGAEKCMEVIRHENAVFDLDVKVSAEGMAVIAAAKFEQKEFVDLAYFEPFYLKDFIAGKPGKMF